jgi:two-component system, cell cycle response regulator
MENNPRQSPLDPEQILEILHGVVFGDSPPQTVPTYLEGYPRFYNLYQALLNTKDFILALSKGDLSASLKQRGILAGELKSLQANLKHLTWQTQRIATGDFTQRVDFMGEFSEAFNTMVRNLNEARQKLLENETRLERLATTDPLTGLLNRRQFFSMAARICEQSRRYDRPLSLILIDIDHFKRVNDTFGHAAGDRVLQEVGRIGLETVRHSDLVARYGGEEFIFLLPETASDQACEVAERLRLGIGGAPLSVLEQSLQLTISLGVSPVPVNSEVGLSPDGVIEQAVARADQALYQSKNAGRNCLTLAKNISGTP